MWRVDAEFSNGTTKTIGSQDGYGYASAKEITLASYLTTDELTQITALRLNTKSGSGSARFTAVYLEKPFSGLVFDNNGVARVDRTDLQYDSNVTIDQQTGIISTSGNGEIILNLGGVDLSSVSNIKLEDNEGNAESVCITNFKLYDNNGVQLWNALYNNCTNRDITEEQAAQYFGNIGKLVWNCYNDNSSDLKESSISCVKITLRNVLVAERGDEVKLNALPSFQKSGDDYVEATTYIPNYRINESTDAAYFGVDWNGEKLNYYTDLTGYSKIRVYQAASTPTVRAFFFNADASNQQSFTNFTWNTEGYYELDLSTVYSAVNNLKLISIRPQQGQTSSVTRMVAIPENVAYDYILSGSGVKTASVLAALADENTTAIDATGVTKATELATANPNCLIKANAGMVANTQNVIVGGTCANLVITDGKPFKVPEQFSALQVSTTRDFKAGLINTVCLPFALTESQVSALGKFYDLSSTQDGDKNVAKFAENMNTVANRPYLFIPKADGVLSLSEEVNVVEGEPETQTYGDFSLMGVQNTTTINSDGTDWVYGFKTDGTLIHITSATELKGMRAYLKVSNASPARQISISFGESTGISSLPLTPSMKENGQWFNLAGQRVAQPTRGLYIINGKKVVR